MRLYSLAAVSLALVISLHAEEVFRVGMDTRSAPWSFVPGLDCSKEGQSKDLQLPEAQLRKLTGIDVDVAAALAQVMGASLRIVPVAWFELENALLAKRIDAILNAWAPGRLTPTTIVASGPSYDWGLLLAVRADDASVRSYADRARLRNKWETPQ